MEEIVRNIYYKDDHDISLVFKLDGGEDILVKLIDEKSHQITNESKPEMVMMSPSITAEELNRYIEHINSLMDKVTDAPEPYDGIEELINVYGDEYKDC